MGLLDLVDENGNPTGEIAERERCHREGLRHRTCHLWLLRRRNGRTELLLQKRSAEKDSNPGCFDISSAGHIPARVDWIPSALRELKEELGLTAQPEQLIYCGVRKIVSDGVYHGKPFHDRQVSRVYALWMDVEPEQLTLQRSEVESVRWIEYDACIEAVRQNAFPHCISLEELELLRPCIADGQIR